MCKIVAPAKLFQLGVLIQSGGVQHHMNHVRHTVYHFVHHKQGYNILIVGGNRLCLWGATMEKVQKCETLKPFCESLYFVNLGVPESRKVGLAVSFLRDSALLWWRSMCQRGNMPTTWDAFTY